MGVSLVVSPRQARELDNVAADQTGIAEPDALLGIDPEARVVVVVQGAAERDLPPAPHSWSSEPHGQVQDGHSLFSGINRADIGDPAIPPGVGFGVFGYH